MPNRRDDVFQFDLSGLFGDPEIHTPVILSFPDGKEEAIVFPPDEASLFRDESRQALEERLISEAKKSHVVFQGAWELIDPIRVKKHAQQWKRKIKTLSQWISVLLAYHLVRIYLHVAKKNGNEAFFAGSPHIRLVKNEYGQPTINITPSALKRALNHLEKRTRKLLLEPGILEEMAEWLEGNLAAWAIMDLIEIKGGEEAVFSLGDEDFDKALKDCYEKRIESGSYDYLFHIYTQDLAKNILEALDLPNATLEDLESILGLKPSLEVEEYQLPARPFPKGGLLSVPSPPHYHALREALATADFHEQDGKDWPTAKLDKGGARGTAELRPVAVDENPLMPPEEVEALQREMWRQRDELSDLDADVLDALSAIWIQQAKSPESAAVCNVDKLLEMRGLKPKLGGQGRRGGFRPEQRAEIIKALSHIQNIWVNMAEIDVYEDTASGRRKRTRQAIQSRVFVITDRMGQLKLDGNMDVRAFIFRPGAVFARYLMGPGRQVALLSAKALQFDPERQQWEKRLARYLSWQWRARAQHGNFLQPYRVSTLLEAVKVEANSRYGGRLRERLEKALDSLHREGIIGAWQYEGWEEPDAENRRWFRHWLDAKVLIEPPDAILSHYRKLGDTTEQANSGPVADMLGEKLREARRRRGLTLAQAAEELGISPSHLSLLERGRRGKKLDPALSKRLQQWLASVP